jgi:YegS/Rv2252/BmrU family lipid kinase
LKHLFIVNPVAGGVKVGTKELQSKVEQFTKALNVPYEIYKTKAPMDACRKIVDAAEKEEELRVYACGGDGTLNECANGAAGRENVALTHYPCGTGNDFLKTFGHENVHKFRDLNALSSGTIRKLDLIDCNGRYGINICSVGIDARVGADVHKYSRIPIIGGRTGYSVSLIANVLKGVTQRFRISVEGKVIDKKITLACACNGRFYGGGFNPIPDAIPDDGILECLIVEPVSRLQVAQIVGRYANGRFREFPDLITYVRGTYMDIECEREFVVNIDGEAVYASKMSFKLVPKGINFIFPPDM